MRSDKIDLYAKTLRKLCVRSSAHFESLTPLQVSKLIFLDGQPTYVMDSLDDAKKAVVSFVFSGRMFRHLSDNQRKVFDAYFIIQNVILL